MKNNSKFTIILSAIIIIIIVALYINIKSYQTKYRWDENYGYSNDQPYGLKLFFDLISETRNKQELVLINNEPKTFLNNSDTSSLYFFIGANYLIDSVNSESLMEFVNRGNIAFISYNSSDNLIFKLLTFGSFQAFEYSYYSDSLVSISFNRNFSDSIFKFDYKIGKKLAYYNWMGLDSTIIADSLLINPFTSISYLPDDKINCFKFKHGNGYFIFHFTPILFSNYNFAKEEGLKYCNTLLSENKKGKIYWDEYSKYPSYEGYNDYNKSPLKFILSEPGLRWSWYLLCFTVLLFIIFNSKRKQAYIPLIPENKNTTIEYIRSIATLHYEKSSHQYLSDEIHKHFMTFIKNRYKIKPTKNNEELARNLASKSAINEEEIKILLKNYYSVQIDTSNSNKNLIVFYQSVENFYKKCK